MDVGKEMVMAKTTAVVLGWAGCKVVATKGCGGHRETVAAVGRVGCRMVAVGRAWWTPRSHGVQEEGRDYGGGWPWGWGYGGRHRGPREIVVSKRKVGTAEEIDCSEVAEWKVDCKMRGSRGDGVHQGNGGGRGMFWPYGGGRSRTLVAFGRVGSCSVVAMAKASCNVVVVTSGMLAPWGSAGCGLLA